MYILRDDYGYLEQLFTTLEETGKLKFLELIMKDGSDKAKLDISTIQVIDKVMLQEWLISPHELLTRSMIRKAYKAAKGAQ